ncbi:FKBP-type peptidyl-prolyl cis-trans isomerase [Leminorella grimontii]|uniref:FKBP-type peptidyl-prolyl cis-trans isomerase n=1 Tax=Leminorella grimontii TaxID=82981 RepID=UPI0020824395|nr:FKBP-type peptidyl-prolyl cis-trans isomerase [Leminorella grimontii]GKX59305.1 hypothetical protein SOASR031_16200 [Leminorella grimontii]
MAFLNKKGSALGALLLIAPSFYALAEEAQAPANAAASSPAEVQQAPESDAVAAPEAEKPTQAAPTADDKAESSAPAQAVEKDGSLQEESAKEESVKKEAPPVNAPAAGDAEKTASADDAKSSTEVKTSPLPAITFSLNSEEQRRAYASGVTLARYLQENMAHQRKLHITLDPNIVLAGIVDTFGNDIKMDDNAVRQTMAVFDEQVNVLNKAKAEQEAVREREMGQAFWSDFERQDGVKKSRSGLLYRIDKKSSGAAISDSDIVEVELTGTLVNGTVFEKTVNPIRLKVSDVIPALRSAIKLAGRGGEARVVIPPEQGYGAKGAQPGIPPYATLIFDIKVLQVTSGKGK